MAELVPTPQKENISVRGHQPVFMQEETPWSFLLANLLCIYFIPGLWGKRPEGPRVTPPEWPLATRECGLRTKLLNSDISS